MKVEEYIQNWFETNSGLKADFFDCLDDNYLEKGYIDSFGFLDLIADCEDTFNISFTDDDFSNDYIFTINGMISVLVEKVGE